MKTFRVYHDDGRPENIEGHSATHKKTNDGLTIRIGNRTIKGAQMLTEVLAERELPKKKLTIVDDE